MGKRIKKTLLHAAVMGKRHIDAIQKDVSDRKTQPRKTQARKKLARTK